MTILRPENIFRDNIGDTHIAKVTIVTIQEGLQTPYPLSNQELKLVGIYFGEVRVIYDGIKNIDLEKSIVDIEVSSDHESSILSSSQYRIVSKENSTGVVQTLASWKVERE